MEENVKAFDRNEFALDILKTSRSDLIAWLHDLNKYFEGGVNAFVLEFVRQRGLRNLGSMRRRKGAKNFCHRNLRSAR